MVILTQEELNNLAYQLEVYKNMTELLQAEIGRLNFELAAARAEIRLTRKILEGVNTDGGEQSTKSVQTNSSVQESTKHDKRNNK